jgi:hypothetical protein
MSLRRLRILVKYLPGEAKLARLIDRRRRAAGLAEHRPIEEADPEVWSQTEWLLVHVHDQLTLLNFAYRQAHAKQKLPPPKFMPRPGGLPARRKTINAWFGAVGLGPPPAQPD